jgi:ABC-2 type transport system ATP-binding protein
MSAAVAADQRPARDLNDEHAIGLDALTRDFGGTRAVDGVTLRVPTGAVYGLLGPNGAGKTTTLKMLAGLLSPTSGTARVAGETIRPGESSLDLRRQVGFLAEEPAFYGWMTAREFLVFVGEIFGQSGRDSTERAAELLDAVGLSERGDSRIKGFSRGMRQRLGIAQALMGEPRVLLLDEPASALDPIGRKEVLELIGSLRSRATIVMSSHILDDVQRVCNWVGVMNKGRLITQAPLETLLQSHAQPVFRLEVADGLADITAALRAEPWLLEAVAEGGGLRILARDPLEAQRRVPALIAAQGARLIEFVTVTPSLEDVFIHLVGAEEPAAPITHADGAA